MRIKLCLTLAFTLTLAHAQGPSVQLKIHERSGFLGIGPARYLQITLSNESQALPLSSTNVNAGSYYYFVLQPVGNWLPDEDFFKEDLPKLSLYQSEQKYTVIWRSDSTAPDSSVLVGFSKNLRLSQLFLVQFDASGGPVQEEMKVPMDLWPGFDVMVNLEALGSAALASGSAQQAVWIYNTILSTDSLRAFPQFAEIKAKRIEAFSQYFAKRQAQVEATLADAQAGLRDKIARLDAIAPQYRFVLDSIANPALGVESTEPAVAAILYNCRSAVSGIALTRDSLQHALDDQNIQWIIEGGATGKNGFLYQYMVEALAYAFSSVNFADTSCQALTFTISPEMKEKLEKQKLTESYDTFLRVCNDRYTDRMPIFPVDFLPNLRRDTAVFAMPYYSMLKAVGDYFSADYGGAVEEIFRVFRTCSDPVLSERFDQMRVVVGIRRGLYPAEALGLLQDAQAAERRGEKDAALEKYRQATAIAPGFSYASYALGRYYDRTGDPIRALPFLQRAYELDTLYLSAYREAANLYRKSGNYKPMIEVLLNALAHGNDYWEIHFNLGLAYLGDADPARAIQHFEQALALSPRNYETNIQLGLAYQSTKNYQKAREYFNNAINIDPLRQAAVDFLTKLNELQRSTR